MIDVDIGGTLNVFEAARILNAKKVVYASSYAVRPTGPTEDASTKPESLYGWCKALDEFLGQTYYHKYGLDNIGLRFGMVYGPGKRAGGMWVVDIVRKPALREPCTLNQNPEMIVQWQNVKDCVKAITLALDAKKTEHKLFNTCAQPSMTLSFSEVSRLISFATLMVLLILFFDRSSESIKPRRKNTLTTLTSGLIASIIPMSFK
jgi:nucleoside-diphosphate-sugar epimerase